MFHSPLSINRQILLYSTNAPQCKEGAVVYYYYYYYSFVVVVVVVVRARHCPAPPPRCRRCAAFPRTTAAAHRARRAPPTRQSPSRKWLQNSQYCAPRGGPSSRRSSRAAAGACRVWMLDPWCRNRGGVAGGAVVRAVRRCWWRAHGSSSRWFLGVYSLMGHQHHGRRLKDNQQAELVCAKL